MKDRYEILEAFGSYMVGDIIETKSYYRPYLEKTGDTAIVNGTCYFTVMAKITDLRTDKRVRKINDTSRSI